MEGGWRVARYDGMASSWAGADWETIRGRMLEQDPAALARWERLAEAYPDSDRTSHSVRRHLGTLLEGRARFVCDGDEGELRVGDFLYLRPETHRELFALETPTTIFVIGGVPGEPYAPPSWAPDWRPPAG